MSDTTPLQLRPTSGVQQENKYLHSTPPDFQRFLALSGERRRKDGDGSNELSEAKAEIATMIKKPPTATWQLGAPLYDPVTKNIRCPEGHPMRQCSMDEYNTRDLLAVTCDFCTRSHRVGAKKRKKLEGEDTRKDEPVLLHCDICDVDLCSRCVDFITAEVRFHVPCMKCTQCGAFVRDDALHKHRCGADPTVDVGSEQPAVASLESHTHWKVEVVNIPAQTTSLQLARLMNLGHTSTTIEESPDPNNAELKKAVVRFASKNRAELVRDFVRRRRSTLPAVKTKAAKTEAVITHVVV